MAVTENRCDVIKTMAGFRRPLIVQSPESAKSKFLSLCLGRAG